MAGRLAGKRILVTASGAGIGRATVLIMAAEGAQVIATDMKAELLDSLAGVAGIETRRLDVLNDADVAAGSARSRSTCCSTAPAGSTRAASSSAAWTAAR
jgi:NAD(P)-dependent dehydrogenase (short-subunit alcohol dehydrogenase family)